ncbi:winged helix DNA-binding domain-containing protein [Microbacterium sp. cx-55]|uniref:winged helix DNA-binding domain-containing protein n=1 Tax=Microbacterium sp. cx-55 TaxID=2875948 RepID=UPI001CBA740C|nr:winged helix DNA-binding domain-containing protein [Microbacterium sp. cx-55]MBZ4488485.1 winged helix DNA-binding domain-containing protein [Microbacterium sp. cx-55]UGB35127.1 winged helix DNA-binding domain-containing protein [Microbacterium sp. cx-55]
MNAPASRDDLLRMRMASQLLAASAPEASGTPPDIAGVARHMLAVQGQDPVAASWALGVRAPGASVADVRAAQRRGEVVRSWPMRATVHLVPAEDIGWMQQLLTPRLLADAARRREQLGFPLDILERMRRIAIERLSGGTQLPRAELFAAFVEEGIEMRPGWSYHAVWWLCQTGTLVFGPPLGARDAALVLADEWITRPRQLEGDDALIELAARYLAGHGPATPADLAWWTKLTLGDARRAFARAAECGRAAVVEVDGAPWWVAPHALDAELPEPPDVLLLPAFDELLLGYRDRSLSADAAHTSLLMSSNGIAVPTVMLRGRAVGSWKLIDGEAVVTPFPGAPHPPASALAQAVAHAERFPR